jgi:hypothetical protein
MTSDIYLCVCVCVCACTPSLDSHIVQPSVFGWQAKYAADCLNFHYVFVAIADVACVTRHTQHNKCLTYVPKC